MLTCSCISLRLYQVNKIINYGEVFTSNNLSAVGRRLGFFVRESFRKLWNIGDLEDITQIHINFILKQETYSNNRGITLNTTHFFTVCELI